MHIAQLRRWPQVEGTGPTAPTALAVDREFVDIYIYTYIYYKFMFLFSYFLWCQERFNLVRIENSSKLPQEVRQIVEYRPQAESQTFGKMRFNTFVKH